MVKNLIIIVTIIATNVFFAKSQVVDSVDEFSFREIPVYDGAFSSGKLAARMVDGLGFRFYWATDSLREEDMSFRPSEETRSIGETIEHIYGMTYLIMGVLGLEYEIDAEKVNYFEQRNQCLANLQAIRNKLIASNEKDFKQFKRLTKNGDTISFWSYINGPIEDCVWHSGQIASFRRLSGNPINSNISFFSGKIRKK